MTFRFAGQELTGINALKGKYADQTAVVCCSGTTFDRYDDSIPPKHWTRIAVNEAIRKTSKYAKFWVLSDDPIVFEYKDFCHDKLTCLVMRQAVRQVKHLKAKKVYTVDSMAEPKNFDNGFQFYSRGTVMIGAIEMARFMGFTRFFCFGLDCFRTKDAYYYDGRRPAKFSENKIEQRDMIRDKTIPHNVQVYVTSLLRKMIDRLELGSKLWKDIEIYCVDSPYSQQTTIPMMTLGEFRMLVEKESEKKEPEDGSTKKPSPSLRAEVASAKADVAGSVPEGDNDGMGKADAGKNSGAGRRKVRRGRKASLPGAGDAVRGDNEVDSPSPERPASEELLRID